MKSIFAMETESANKVLCEIAEPIYRVFGDPAVNEAIANVANNFGDRPSGLQVMATCAKYYVPVMLSKEHKADVYKIISVLKGITIEEVKKQSLFQTITDITDLISMEDTARFHSSGVDGGT